jgi:hypothetical protein
VWTMTVRWMAGAAEPRNFGVASGTAPGSPEAGCGYGYIDEFNSGLYFGLPFWVWVEDCFRLRADMLIYRPQPPPPWYLEWISLVMGKPPEAVMLS